MKLKKAVMMGLLYDLVFAYILTNFTGYASEFVYGILPVMSLVTTAVGALTLASIWVDQTFVTQRFHRDDSLLTLLCYAAGIIVAGILSRTQSKMWLGSFPMFARYAAILSGLILIQYIAVFFTTEELDRRLSIFYILMTGIRTALLAAASFLALNWSVLLTLVAVEIAHLMPIAIRQHLDISKTTFAHINEKMALLLIFVMTKKMIFDIVFFFIKKNALTVPQLLLHIVFLITTAFWGTLHFDRLMNNRRELKGASVICTYIFVIASTVILVTGMDILTEPLVEPLFAVSIFYLCVTAFDLSLIFGVRHYHMKVKHRMTVITGLVVMYLFGLSLSLKFLQNPTVILLFTAIMGVGIVAFSLEATRHMLE